NLTTVRENIMQQCTMNGNTFKRLDDGRIFLNGNEIIENQIQRKISAQVAFFIYFIGFLMGLLF
ncbi:unnamed protein product, partial [marine sediment metagenome]